MKIPTAITKGDEEYFAETYAAVQERLADEIHGIAMKAADEIPAEVVAEQILRLALELVAGISSDLDCKAVAAKVENYLIYSLAEIEKEEANA